MIGHLVYLFGVFLLVNQVNCGEFDYSIATTWDNHTLHEHAPIKVSLSSSNNRLIVKISGPFLNEPSGPAAAPGVAFWGLWNYESVKLFFLGADNRHLEVEVAPQGQHFVSFLNEHKHDLAHCLPLTYNATITGNTWSGVANISADYFPPKVTKFNAYAVHGCGSDRHDEALYPVPAHKFRAPDT